MVPYSIENLRPICSGCNNSMHTTSMLDFIINNNFRNSSTEPPTPQLKASTQPPLQASRAPPPPPPPRASAYEIPKYIYSTICNHCGLCGHKKAHCPRKDENKKTFSICSGCGEVGHNANNQHCPLNCSCKSCNEKFNNNICRQCGLRGHKKHNCPRKDEDAENFIACGKCGRFGHNKSNELCPKYYM